MTHPQIKSQKKLEELSDALDSGTFTDVRRMLNGMPTADVAHLLESSPPRFRHILWQLVEAEREGEVLGELSDDLQALFLRDMDAAKVESVPPRQGLGVAGFPPGVLCPTREPLYSAFGLAERHRCSR